MFGRRRPASAARNGATTQDGLSLLSGWPCIIGGVIERSFRAMGTDVHIVVCGAPPLLAAACQRVHDLEARWSRFLPGSEVSALNRQAGRAVSVSPETVELVRRAIDGWRMSGGSIDPTVLGAVLRAGYTVSFDQLDAAQETPLMRLATGCHQIEVLGGTVRLPAGVGFDPGGIGKGLAADIVVAEAITGGADGICVNLGGDLRVAGSAPGGGAWTITIEDPWTRRPLEQVGLCGGAVATSSTLRRTWKVGAEIRHHLIDPATGVPSESDLVSATVLAGEGWMADVLAKAVLLRGSTHPFDLLGGSGAAAFVVDRHGRVQRSPGFDAFAGRPQGVA